MIFSFRSLMTPTSPKSYRTWTMRYGSMTMPPPTETAEPADALPGELRRTEGFSSPPSPGNWEAVLGRRHRRLGALRVASRERDRAENPAGGDRIAFGHDVVDREVIARYTTDVSALVNVSLCDECGWSFPPSPRAVTTKSKAVGGMVGDVSKIRTTSPPGPEGTGKLTERIHRRRRIARSLRGDGPPIG